MIVKDLNFAMEQAQEVLQRLDTEAEKIGLYCNAKKTKVQTFNQEKPFIIKAKNGETLKEVKNFKCLGA